MLGQDAVLVVLLSLVTWVPGLLLFFLQGYLDGAGWLGQNLVDRAAPSSWGAGSGSCALAVALAVSAWVKWKPRRARRAVVVFFVLVRLRPRRSTSARHLVGLAALGLAAVIESLWTSLFGLQRDRQRSRAMPRWAAWAGARRRLRCSASGSSPGASGRTRWCDERRRDADRRVVFDDVSKFYGEVLGVNRVNLSIPPGITSLVGPNGSGKTTLMNLMTGLIRPDPRPRSRVLGLPPDDPESSSASVGYCTQFDAFPRGAHRLPVHRALPAPARLRAQEAERADAGRRSSASGSTDAAERKVAGYSKGMRQRDQARPGDRATSPRCWCSTSRSTASTRWRAPRPSRSSASWRTAGLHVIVSSHILHEVDLISDQVVLLNHGYVVAEGEIPDVRDEMEEHPMQILIRCDRPSLLAVAALRAGPRGRGPHPRRRPAACSCARATPTASTCCSTRSCWSSGLDLEAVAPADADVNAVYQYLIGSNGEKS